MVVFYRLKGWMESLLWGDIISCQGRCIQKGIKYQPQTYNRDKCKALSNLRFFWKKICWVVNSSFDLMQRWIKKKHELHPPKTKVTWWKLNREWRCISLWKMRDFCLLNATQGSKLFMKWKDAFWGDRKSRQFFDLKLHPPSPHRVWWHPFSQLWSPQMEISRKTNMSLKFNGWKMYFLWK